LIILLPRVKEFLAIQYQNLELAGRKSLVKKWSILPKYLVFQTIFLHGYTYMAYSNSHIGNYRPWGFLCLCFFIGMYGMNTAILTIQFIYRYLAVCRSQRNFSFCNIKFTKVFATENNDKMRLLSLNTVLKSSYVQCKQTSRVV
uniref:Very-long-chain 3-oxoacyl-CoA synthase n=1 Tax=Angiostrongylus cantonensis TaxID=6313 RepID=A0A0K0DHY6_ANGCA